MLQLGDRKKIIQVHESDSQTFEQLIIEVKKCFKIPENTKVYLKKFDCEWNDYIEIDNIDDVTDKDRLVVEQESISIVAEKQVGFIICRIAMGKADLVFIIHTHPTSVDLPPWQ